jgi:hypothetical protein
MALVIADRVKETTTTTGTGTVTLLGASTGFQSFAAVGNGNTTYYTIAGQTSSEWEVGIGTYTSSGTTLARTTVLASSNSGSLVNFSAGTKDVFVTYPAEKSVNQDASGAVNIPAQLALVNTALTSSNVSNLNLGGPLSFSDTGLIADFVATLNGYLQAVIQNKSSGASASAEFIAYNDSGTASTNYATVGINSSGYTGTGAINGAGYGYFLTGSTDLVLGTIGNNAIHFVVNSGATDALTISTAGAVTTPNTLTGSNVVASNGLHVNSQTVSASYTIAAGSSAMSAGPISVASGVSVTLGSGSRWVVI